MWVFIATSTIPVWVTEPDAIRMDERGIQLFVVTRWNAPIQKHKEKEL